MTRHDQLLAAYTERRPSPPLAVSRYRWPVCANPHPIKLETREKVMASVAGMRLVNDGDRSVLK